MCGCGGDGPSDGGVPGSPPGGTTGGTALCCACPTSGTVNENTKPRYFNTTGYFQSNDTNKCSIDIKRTKSAGTVTISTSFSLAYVNGATAASDKTTATNAISSAMTNWTGGAAAYKVRIEQTGCDPQELKIVFKSTIVASGADVSVKVDGTAAPTPPSNVAGGTVMEIYLNDSGNISWNMTHETGHTFGLPDEYCEVPGIPIVPPPTTVGAPTITPPAVSPTTTYKGCPPQADVTITQTANVPSPRTPGTYLFDNATIMGRNGNTTYKKYMFFWIAIEVKKLLADANTPATVSIV